MEKKAFNRMLKILMLLAYLFVFVVFRFVLGFSGVGYLWTQCIAYVVLGVVGVFAYLNSILDGINQWKKHTIKNILWFIGIYIANIILTNLSYFPITILYPDYESGQENSIFIAFTQTNVPAILLILALGVFGPILEEATYRLNMVADVKRKSLVWICVVLSSILFMSGHMHELSVPELLKALPHFVTGILYGISYCATKNSTIPIGLHILNNLPTLIMIWASIQ